MAEKGVEEQVLAMERLHYNCVDEHDYNQRMQILLPFDRVFPLL